MTRGNVVELHALIDSEGLARDEYVPDAIGAAAVRIYGIRKRVAADPLSEPAEVKPRRVDDNHPLATRICSKVESAGSSRRRERFVSWIDAVCAVTVRCTDELPIAVRI